MALEAARHLCEEARVVLTSVRGGPPVVARGDLAQDLVELRGIVKEVLSNSCHQRSDAKDRVNPAATPPVLTNGSDSSNNNSNNYTFEPPTSFNPPQLEDVGVFARPFLNVVMDPRAAGPHTLVALRALHRLLERGSLAATTMMMTTTTTTAAAAVGVTKQPPSSSSGLMLLSPSSTTETSHDFVVALEPLTKGVLNCKFEQTDAGADEAVEMAIADLLALIVKLDRRSLKPETLMDAFNTVFVTRNTFVHSPALCYHFEDVLTAMCKVVFGDLDSLRDKVGKMILEFLVNQLLHTPLMTAMDEASREAQMAHDATRILCLRLARTALKAVFEENVWSSDDLAEASAGGVPGSEEPSDRFSRNLLQIIQDDLCLALLITGQAIWSVQAGSSSYIAPGVISLEVLAEICSTLSSLWTITSLRKHLVSQFEAIFTGFYQRALVLLRKRVNPTDAATFQSNLYFDAGVEIILESLVDIMTMHDHRLTVAEGNGGSLETLFSLYDCNIKRSDVAVGLMVDLCRCTGSKVNEEGQIFDRSIHGDLPVQQNGDAIAHSAGGDSLPPIEDFPASNNAVTTDGYRPVPPHLKELCAEAIIGGMKCLFRDDHPSEQTKAERHNRNSILAGHVSPAPQSWSDLNRVTSSHHLRNLKSKKRLIRQAAQLFNKKSSQGIEFLVHSGVIQEPVTPRAVASFLRNGIVVGLDKKAVGAYLGEIGKSPEAGKSPPVWQRDWFHKEVLEAYCSLFRFERQSLLDGLRMFLAAFRLPGEAQQIDRILQAFSDTCSRVCEEGIQGSMKLFSEDPKRASDAAYLLSFSIIMLNTDQHNDNIREDRKMKKEDFVRNNTDYGRDITEKGKELPREYLESIYNGIREEEIRTEGEGADGSMTVERWKDVLRGSAEEVAQTDDLPSVHDAEDLTELVLEHLWMPIISSISALWGGTNSKPTKENGGDNGTTTMISTQGARLGMDMAWDMLVGVRLLGRNDMFGKIFNCVCKYSGLLDYKDDVVTRCLNFAHSVESQSAFIVAFRVAKEASNEISIDGWKRIWSMLFELRDLKMLGGGVSRRGKSLLRESESDFLREEGRREWNMKLLKQANGETGPKRSAVGSVFGAVGRALFGGSDTQAQSDAANRQPARDRIKTVHGKENHLLWDDIASSDDEDGPEGSGDETENSFSIHGSLRLTVGAKFENQLIQEDLLLNQQREITVTGLERVDEANSVRLSPRARVRKRLSKGCDFAGLITDSRLMDDKSIQNILAALVSLIPSEFSMNTNRSVSSSSLDRDASSTDFTPRLTEYPISPASEALAEVMITELALRNRDRLSVLWHSHLREHYQSRVKSIVNTYCEDDKGHHQMISGSQEKCLTGLLRISCCAIKRGDICNDILSTWTLLDEIEVDESKNSLAYAFDRHLAEGLWRITRCVDGSTELSADGWGGILSLTSWCANRGFTLPRVRADSIGKTVGLSEDDPSLQAYRSVHFLLNSEIKESVPVAVVKCIRTLVATGQVRRCPKLGTAALDQLRDLCRIVEAGAIDVYREGTEEEKNAHWDMKWVPILERIAEACHSYSNSIVRQHALSILCDTVLEMQGNLIPVPHLCGALGRICIPLSGRRILHLRGSEISIEKRDEVMMELELCISLLFKPLRHHIQNIIKEGAEALMSLWTPILEIVKGILNEATVEANEIVKSSNELVIEHFRNVVMVLINLDILEAVSSANDGLTLATWKAISEMEGCKQFVEEWQKAAANRHELANQ